MRNRGALRWTLITLLAFAGLGLLVARSPSFQECINNPQQQQTNQQPNQSGSIFSIPRTRYEACLGVFVDENNGAITAFATVLLTIVTGGLILVALKQERTTRIQLRAYVGIATADVVNVAPLPVTVPGQIPLQATNATFGNPTIGPAAVIVIKNTGQTSALDVINWAEIYIREHPLKAPLPPKPTGFIATKMTFAPGGGSGKTIALPRPLSPQEIADLRAGTIAIYVNGGIEYKDAFGKPHFTNFRFFHNTYSGNVGVSTALTGASDGNEAD